LTFREPLQADSLELGLATGLAADSGNPVSRREEEVSTIVMWSAPDLARGVTSILLSDRPGDAW